MADGGPRRAAVVDADRGLRPYPAVDGLCRLGLGHRRSAEALKLLARFGSVTVLNGHIHQITQKVEGRIAFHTARSTAFPQPAPGHGAVAGAAEGPARAAHAMLGITDAMFVRGHDRIALINSTLSA